MMIHTGCCQQPKLSKCTGKCKSIQGCCIILTQSKYRGSAGKHLWSTLGLRLALAAARGTKDVISKKLQA